MNRRFSEYSPLIFARGGRWPHKKGGKILHNGRHEDRCPRARVRRLGVGGAQNLWNGAAQDRAPAIHPAAVMVERRYPDQGGGLLTIERGQLRQPSQQRGAQHWSNSGHAI